MRLWVQKAMFARRVFILLLSNLIYISPQTTLHWAASCTSTSKRYITNHFKQETRKTDAWMGDSLFQAGLAREPRRAPELQERTNDRKRQQNHLS
jgi:hypothetical protein